MCKNREFKLKVELSDLGLIYHVKFSIYVSSYTKQNYNDYPTLFRLITDNLNV
jgi:hypothetical protein